MRIADWNLDDRPREKMEMHGARTLGNAELLAVLLRAGTREMNAVDLARDLLAFGGGTLTRLSQMPVKELCARKGIGKGKALAVLAALELGRRMMQERDGVAGPLVTSPRDIYDRMLPVLKGLEKETCWAVYLGRGGRISGQERLSDGDESTTVLDASDVARRCVAAKARRVILVHNHPSGDPTPSPADIRLTGEIKRALSLFRIELTDHIIVSDGTFFSFDRQSLTAV